MFIILIADKVVSPIYALALMFLDGPTIFPTLFLLIMWRVL
ncbi:MAG: hypothetical protein QXI72_06495 [Candidatus Nezhaarchaeales archaeon]